jgi:hypothetical protein
VEREACVGTEVSSSSSHAALAISRLNHCSQPPMSSARHAGALLLLLLSEHEGYLTRTWRCIMKEAFFLIV